MQRNNLYECAKLIKTQPAIPRRQFTSFRTDVYGNLTQVSANTQKSRVSQNHVSAMSKQSAMHTGVIEYVPVISYFGIPNDIPLHPLVDERLTRTYGNDTFSRARSSNHNDGQAPRMRLTAGSQLFPPQTSCLHVDRRESVANKVNHTSGSKDMISDFVPRKTIKTPYLS